MDADVAHLINELIHLSIWSGINSAVKKVISIVGLSTPFVSHLGAYTYRSLSSSRKMSI